MKQLYKDPQLEPLFNRRTEIKEQVNKLMEEYKALEYVIKENIKLKENQREEER